MTNEELKKKIESIIRNAKRDFAYCVPEEWAVKVLADALIAAGIGDVKRHRVFVSKDGKEVKQLYSGEEVEKIAREREEYKHRAEVAERALRDRATYCAMEDMDYFSLTQVAIEARAKELYEGWRREAEKELTKEEKE